jgi:hypothetical protein
MTAGQLLDIRASACRCLIVFRGLYVTDIGGVEAGVLPTRQVS